MIHHILLILKQRSSAFGWMAIVSQHFGSIAQSRPESNKMLPATSVRLHRCFIELCWVVGMVILTPQSLHCRCDRPRQPPPIKGNQRFSLRQQCSACRGRLGQRCFQPFEIIALRFVAPVHCASHIQLTFKIVSTAAAYAQQRA